MSIYDLKIKDLRKEMIKFKNTVYGSTVFLLAYLIPMISLIVCIISAVLGLVQGVELYLTYSLILVVVTIVSFLIGNAYYYRELREFVNYKANNKKK